MIKKILKNKSNWFTIFGICTFLFSPIYTSIRAHQSGFLTLFLKATFPLIVMQIGIIAILVAMMIDESRQ